MILLDAFNHAIEEILCSYFESEKLEPGEKVKLDHKLADFDGVTYQLKEGSDRRSILLSMSMSCFKELEEHGVMEHLRKIYGTLMTGKPEPGYNVTLSIDLNTVPDDYEPLARKCAMLKRHCVATVFVKFFDTQSKLDPKSTGPRAVIHFRPDSTMYIQALHDRVTVIFSTKFKDADDIVIGKVFLQEFTQSQKRVDRAPQVLYSQRNPPAELQNTGAAVSDSLAYITFVLYPRHVTNGPSRDKTIDLLSMFCTYLQYHIKCSKAYVQMRMRAKTSEFIKILNRARVEATALPVITAGSKRGN